MKTDLRIGKGLYKRNILQKIQNYSQ